MATTTKGGGRDYRSRLVTVSPRLIFIPTGTGRTRVPNASIVAPTSSPSLGTFDRVRIDPNALRLATPRTLFRPPGRPHTVARARTTGDDDGRRETGDGRRETRRRARRARGDDVRLDVSTRKAVGRGETTASVRFFHAWVDAREGLVRRSSLLVGDDSHGFGESSRRISTSRPRGGA